MVTASSLLRKFIFTGAAQFFESGKPSNSLRRIYIRNGEIRKDLFEGTVNLGTGVLERYSTKIHQM